VTSWHFSSSSCQKVWALLAPPTDAPNPLSYNPVCVIQNQEMYPLVGTNGLAGQVVGINVIAGGTGYSSATTVTIGAVQTPQTTAEELLSTTRFPLARVETQQRAKHSRRPEDPGSNKAALASNIYWFYDILQEDKRDHKSTARERQDDFAELIDTLPLG